MNHPLAAAVAFFALGVSAFGTALLLLFNPRSGSVRWFAVFQLSILAWLGAQGWAMAVGDFTGVRPVISGALHLAPGLFLAFAFHTWPGRRWSWLPVAVALALLPLDLASIGTGRYEAILALWNVAGWGTGTVLTVSQLHRSRALPGPERRRARVILALMALVMPASIVGGQLFGAPMGVYVMPLLMVWIQALTFVGIARARFYDIEVRAARTGDLAAGAAEQARLAVVGELAASLAHEIRNPLTGVRSLAQRLAEDEVDEGRRRRYAGVILEEVGRVERLVGNLLGVARRAPRGPSPAGETTPLAPLFDDLALLVSSRAEKRRVRLTADAAGLAAPAAREPLAQALLNLLLNAVDHTPAGGAVELRARTVDGAVEVVVRDTGPGVPADERERIWEPFHTGSGGTGLGLAVVRSLAREEGWTPAVTDGPGGGAEFTLRLPHPPAGGDASSSSSPTPPSAASSDVRRGAPAWDARLDGAAR
jgi:signal transduction histidine kinase